MLDTHGRKLFDPMINKVAGFLISVSFSANQVTCLAFMIGISAGLLTYFNLAFWAVLALWISGFLDAVDGSIARKTQTSSPWGTVLDITFDRVVEISIILGLAYRFPLSIWAMLLLTSAIIISMTIFLSVGNVSPKKGMKSFYYQAGLAERTEGFIMLTAMILLTQYLTFITLIFAGMVIFTAGQRLIEAHKILSN
jgi:phosphatidylglycerophosphate synthase